MKAADITSSAAEEIADDLADEVFFNDHPWPLFAAGGFFQFVQVQLFHVLSIDLISSVS